MTTLVLGPSLGTTAAGLWGRCAALLPADVEVVTWDLPGHGGAQPAGLPAGLPVGLPTGPEPLTVADLAAGVLAQVDGPFHYAGDSVGGAVGLQLLLDAPERVLSAVLLCTGARIGEPPLWTGRAAAVRAGGTASLVEATRARWFGPGFADREPAVAAALLDGLAEVDDEGYVAVCAALASYDVRARLGEITVPVLAVAGSHDVATPPDLLAEVADGVVDGRLVVLDGVGHLAPAEAPRDVARLIADHLTDHLERQTP